MGRWGRSLLQKSVAFLSGPEMQQEGRRLVLLAVGRGPGRVGQVACAEDLVAGLGFVLRSIGSHG